MLFTTRNQRLLVFLLAKAPKGTKRSLVHIEALPI